MSINISGTLPVLNNFKSQIDEYGFDYETYEYVIKTSTLGIYSFKKDDVFNGIGLDNIYSYRSLSSGDIPYWITSFSSSPENGGLTKLTINTVGTRLVPSEQKPVVKIRQGGPFIFGLKSASTSGTVGGYGLGLSNGGIEISIEFLDYGGGPSETGVIQLYLGNIMPASFRGISLPTPARSPGFIPKTYVLPSPFGGLRIFGTTYYGFTCKSVNVERRGAFALYRINYSEAGKFVDATNITATNITSSTIWSFPAIG